MRTKTKHLENFWINSYRMGYRCRVEQKKMLINWFVVLRDIPGRREEKRSNIVQNWISFDRHRCRVKYPIGSSYKLSSNLKISCLILPHHFRFVYIPSIFEHRQKGTNQDENWISISQNEIISRRVQRVLHNILCCRCRLLLLLLVFHFLFLSCISDDVVFFFSEKKLRMRIEEEKNGEKWRKKISVHGARLWVHYSAHKKKTPNE